jgi:GNAT superfamily N-acetyltransferase
VTDWDVSIELAEPADVALLADIEVAAGALFAGQPVALDADPSPTAVETLAEAQRAGRLWVARTPAGAVVGFALVESLAGQPHLEEMDVHPEFGRRGIGRRLLAAVQAWARDSRFARVTLTTFREIPWNAPFYASCGFRALDATQWQPALAAVVREEAARGLDPTERLVMAWSPEEVSD